jgi:glycosyltransferase involved in cell wall biosynthesis
MPRLHLDHPPARFRTVPDLDRADRTTTHRHLGVDLDPRRPHHDDRYGTTREWGRRAAMTVAGLARCSAAHEVASGERGLRTWALERWASSPAVPPPGAGEVVHVHVRGARDLDPLRPATAAVAGPLVVHLHLTDGSARQLCSSPPHAQAHARLARLVQRARLTIVPTAHQVPVARALGARAVVSVTGAPPPVAHGLSPRPPRPAPSLWGRRIVATGGQPAHRVADLVDALAAQPTDVDLILLDDAGVGPHLRTAVDRLALGHRVHVLQRPTWEEVDAHLWHADVVTTVADSGEDVVTLLRAMQIGRPVVAAGAGDRRQLISTGVDGLLTPPGDRWALAGGLRRMLTDAPMAHALGTAAARRVAARSWEDVGGEILLALDATRHGAHP